MTWIRVFWRRLRGLFLKRKLEQELEDEIRAHLEMQIDDNLKEGMSPDEARYAALRKFGGVERVKEEYRDRLSLAAVETAFQDLRYGLRMLRRNPGFTFVAVLTLALGIGANTAIFSVVNAVLLQSLPYRDPDRLVAASYYRGVAGDYARVEDFQAWRDQAKAFEQIAAYRTDDADLTGNGEPERLTAATVSASLFATLGVAPALGRDFTPEDDTDGGAPVVILSDGLWRRRFGGDPQVIGKAITLRGQSLTVIGIMPPGFRFPGETELWAPLMPILNRQLSQQPSMGRLNVLARLKPGAPPEGAKAELSVILERLRQDSPRIYSFVQEVRVVKLGERLRCWP
ncbi:MAG: ABC transporter permease [Chloracidobacterium sp.]|nr:ABC transporter permease [Chloracidobacterium sp.]